MTESASPVNSSDLAGAVPDDRPVYKTAAEGELRLHVFRSVAAAGAAPGIVFFFGGGWLNGTPEQFYPHCRYLARRGMVAAAAEYRVEAKHGTPPSACVEDGKAALRYMRAHASELGLDAGKLAAGGGSAGGHVAAAAALCDGFDGDDADSPVSSRPDALVLFNPVFDNGPNGWGHERVRDSWRTISPLHNIDAAAPPTTVFLGTADPLIPVATAQDYSQRMVACGRRCDLHLYEDQPHGFFNFRDGANPYFNRTLTTADRFLASLDYLAGEPLLAALPEE
ncbi:MAG: alpha/beta hydrolase fold domain-containing protein [Candidatus Latescibacteria bacterium]|nr:alpha/beta hydrolase fold domain-containing protein [Candidatus Latescibacterota bacterium]